MSVETYTRPFGPNAPWNIPVDGLPLNERGDQLSTLLWNDGFTDRELRNFNINNTSYTYPVYEATKDTPTYTVIDLSGNGNLGGKRMPFDPSWKPAPGSDGQIIVLDPATGREWDLWQATFNGSAVTVSNGNLVPGSYFEREDGFQPSRGVGIQYLAMLVRPEEVAQGKIEHALSMPISNTSGSEFAAPGTKIEFPGVRMNGIPEGTRFALDVTYAEIDAHLASLPSSVPDATIASLRVIMVALKDYGWFITDTSGGQHFQLELTTSAYDEWAALGLVDTGFGGAVYPRDALDGLITKDRIVAYAPSDKYPPNTTTPEPDPDAPGDDGPDDGEGPGDVIAPFTVQAEDFTIIRGFSVEAPAVLKGGHVLFSNADLGELRASYSFDRPSDTYDIKVVYFDETDGISSVSVLVDGRKVDGWKLDSKAGDTTASAKSLTSHLIEDAHIERGQTIEIVGQRNNGELVRIDALHFNPSGEGSGGSAPGPAVPKPATARVEAERMVLDDAFDFESLKAASGGRNLVLAAESGWHDASLAFGGVDGRYDVVVGYFDESDGAAGMRLLLNGTRVASWTWDEKLGGTTGTAANRTTHTISGLELNAGDELVLSGRRDGGELVRLDYVDFVPSNDWDLA